MFLQLVNAETDAYKVAKTILKISSSEILRDTEPITN